MDNLKYNKTSPNSKLKTRSIGINTDENQKCVCGSEGSCPKILLVPYLPYYYPVCSNTFNANCMNGSQNCMPGNPNIMNQYPLNASLPEESKSNCTCTKPSSVKLLHCCSSFNCCSSTNCNCTNCISKNTFNVTANDMITMKSQTVISNTPTFQNNQNENVVKKVTPQNSDENTSYAKPKNQIETFNIEKDPYFNKINNDLGKEFLTEEEMNKYAKEFLENQKTYQQDFESIKKLNAERSKVEDKKILNSLLTPSRSNFNQPVNTTEDSDVDSDNDDESSIDDDDNNLAENSKYSSENRNFRAPNTESRIPHYNEPTNFPKKNTDVEMLMMLKAFVSQQGDNDKNSKLNKLITHLSTQEVKQESRKPTMPRKKIINNNTPNPNE